MKNSHDLEATGSNSGQIELGVLTRLVLSKLPKIFLWPTTSLSQKARWQQRSRHSSQNNTSWCLPNRHQMITICSSLCLTTVHAQYVLGLVCCLQENVMTQDLEVSKGAQVASHLAETPTRQDENLKWMPFCFLYTDFSENLIRPRTHLYLSTCYISWTSAMQFLSYHLHKQISYCFRLGGLISPEQK